MDFYNIYSSVFDYLFLFFLVAKTTLFDFSNFCLLLLSDLYSMLPKNIVPLPQRMSYYLEKYNSFTAHSYKGHVVILKSRRLLELFTTNKNSIDKLDMIHSSMINICESLIEKYNPRLIYTFNDEIHLVFMYDEDDNSRYIFDGNVHKLLTHMSSTFTYLISKVNLLSVNPEVTAKFVQFNDDHELLNFIAWKQSHCFSKAQETSPSLNIDNVPLWYKFGTFLKKKMFVKFDSNVERDVDYDYTSVYPEDIVFRKQTVTFHKHLFSEFTNFDECFKLLIVNKHLLDRDS